MSAKGRWKPLSEANYRTSTESSLINRVKTADPVPETLEDPILNELAIYLTGPHGGDIVLSPRSETSFPVNLKLPRHGKTGDAYFLEGSMCLKEYEVLVAQAIMPGAMLSQHEIRFLNPNSREVIIPSRT